MIKALPKRCHGDDGVPEGDWDAGKVGVVDVLLGVEDDGGEDNDGHREREDEKAEFTST